MNIALWVLQVLFGVYFVAVGAMHFIVPDGLPALMSWMYELSDTMHYISGTAEILGGLGLILPGVTRIRPELTVWAASGLALLMVGAAIWHVGRGEAVSIGLNVVNAVVLGFIAYGRAKLVPLEARSA